MSGKKVTLAAIAVSVGAFLAAGLHHQMAAAAREPSQAWFVLLAPILIPSLALLGVFSPVLRRALSAYRGRSGKGAGGLPPVARPAGPKPSALAPYLLAIRERCSDCGTCTQSCAFLAHHGTPKAIVAACDFTSPRHLAIAYECSLCGLCTAVCPEGLDPSGLFLECRRLSVAGGIFSTFAYRAILSYEKCGTSSLFSWYDIPEGCDTAFFPGCGLPGTRPKVTLSMFWELRKNIPNLGVVLDCCTRPSHDLGRSSRPGS